jgi:hypothetical protein
MQLRVASVCLAISCASASAQSPCNAADLVPPFQQHTFGDVSAFIGAFGLQDPIADLADPPGQFTFGDISAFIADFSAGCPQLPCDPLGQPPALVPITNVQGLVPIGPGEVEYVFNGQVQQAFLPDGTVVWQGLQMQGLPAQPPALGPIDISADGIGMGFVDPLSLEFVGGDQPVLVDIGQTGNPQPALISVVPPSDLECLSPTQVRFGMEAQMNLGIGPVAFLGICGDDEPDEVEVTTGNGRWCVYGVKSIRATADDCPFDVADTICIQCPASGSCPNIIGIRIGGENCVAFLARQGGPGCRACPGAVPDGRRYRFR